jgi:hypothetical protein
MKAYWGVELQLHAFLTSERDGGEWSVSRPGRFTSGKRFSVRINCMRGADPSLFWHVLEDRSSDITARVWSSDNAACPRQEGRRQKAVTGLEPRISRIQSCHVVLGTCQKMNVSCLVCCKRIGWQTRAKMKESKMFRLKTLYFAWLDSWVYEMQSVMTFWSISFLSHRFS